MQIRRPRRQGDPVYPSRVDALLKGGAVFPIPIVDQVLPRREEAPLLHRHVAGHLHHPRLIGMRCHTSHMDVSAAQMDEKEGSVSKVEMAMFIPPVQRHSG